MRENIFLNSERAIPPAWFMNITIFSVFLLLLFPAIPLNHAARHNPRESKAHAANMLVTCTEASRERQRLNSNVIQTHN
jgi:hypothetical protein